MNDQQITVNPKQLLTFLGIAVVMTLGVVGFFFISSGQKTASEPVAENSNLPPANIDNPEMDEGDNDGFWGEKGATVEVTEGKVYLNEAGVSDGNMHAFNYFSEEKNKTIYFFIVKASDGTYRAAANACEVCFGARKGFRQVGDLIRCENCRVTYPKDKIALEKGGCNPGPIDKNVLVEDKKLAIHASDIEKVAYLF